MDAPQPLNRYHVALLGFGSFERLGLEACLRLMSRREPAFVLSPVDAPLAASDWVVINGDQPEALQAVWASGQVATTIVVGATEIPGAALHLPRPIDPLALQRGLEALAGVEPSVAPAPAPVRTIGNDAVGGRRFSHPMLVVDDSEVARQYLCVQLERLGCAVHTAQSADEARAQLALQTYAAVFVDLALDPSEANELEGLVLCHELAQGGAVNGKRPRIVVVSARSSGTDRVRATLAGCDSFRVKPVTAAALEEELQVIEVAATAH